MDKKKIKKQIKEKRRKESEERKESLEAGKKIIKSFFKKN
jgi:hypothetical protein